MTRREGRGVAAAAERVGEQVEDGWTIATLIPPYDDLQPLPISALPGGDNGELMSAQQVGVVF
jgi:hypothetical protein